MYTHEGIDLHVIWTKAHSTLEDKAKMSPENRQVSWGSETADELAKTGAVKDCAEMVAEHALNTRQVYAAIRHAATFLDEVGELDRVEEVGEEDKKTSPGGNLAIRRPMVASTEWTELWKENISSAAQGAV